MSGTPPVGLCRFSFVGRGDWRVWRRRDAPSREEVAAQLYDPARMAERFWTFENLLLPSLLGQTEEDWRLALLTSDLMPAHMQDRLRDVASDPRIHVEVSEAEDVNTAVLPLVDRLGLNDAAQFRIDDDDALGRSYVSRLCEVARALEPMGSFTYSISVGLVATCYAGEGPRGYRMIQPFHSVGTAIRTPPHQRGKMSVFSFGHFNLQRRWMSVCDTGVRGRTGMGYLSTRKHGHDSTPDDPSAKLAAAEPLDWDVFDAVLAEDFPHVDGPTLRAHLARGVEGPAEVEGMATAPGAEGRG